MTTDDPRVECHRLHGEEVYIPNADAWRDIMRDGGLGGSPVPMPEWVARWLDDYSRFAVAALGVRRLKPSPRQWHLLPLLKLGGRLLRVHYEDVVCEHCGRRCGPSATPDVVQYAGTSLSTAQAWSEFVPFPVQHCPHCGGVLRRRQTVWLASADRAA